MALASPPPAAGTSVQTPDGPTPPPSDDTADGGGARRRIRRPKATTVLITLLVLGLVAVGGLYWSSTRGPVPPTQAEVEEQVQSRIQSALEEQAAQPPEGQQAYQAIAPSLVHISVTRSATATGDASSGIGAGVVANADGTILTANHVIEGADTIRVTFADGSESSAEVAEADEATDTASLTPATLPQTLVPAVIGGGAEVGHDVYAVGDPLGLTTTFTAGVVSQLDRSIRVEGGRTLEGLIQFDAAVNPGNSGGPLVNGAGQVVGIVTGLANPSSQPFFVGIGFAVPIAAAGGGDGPPQ